MTDHKAEWVLVPRVATPEMVEAAQRREDDEPLSSWGTVIQASHSEIYAAMIAAAPAAQAADDPSASTKHDEGREALIAAYTQGAHDFAGEGYCLADNTEVQVQAEHYADTTLATQPAANVANATEAKLPCRVTELEVSAAADRLVRKWNLHGPDAYRMANDALNAAAESFAQPAEGVSRKKHDGPCWRNSHADCGC